MGRVVASMMVAAKAKTVAGNAVAVKVGAVAVVGARVAAMTVVVVTVVAWVKVVAKAAAEKAVVEVRKVLKMTLAREVAGGLAAERGGKRGCGCSGSGSRAAEVMVVEEKARGVVEKVVRRVIEVLQVAMVTVALTLAREVAGRGGGERGEAPMGAAVKVVAANMVSEKAEARAEKAADATV